MTKKLHKKIVYDKDKKTVCKVCGDAPKFKLGFCEGCYNYAKENNIILKR